MPTVLVMIRFSPKFTVNSLKLGSSSRARSRWKRLDPGCTDRLMHKIEESASIVLPLAKEALARGNVDFSRYELNDLLQVFRINLDRNCPDYRKLALAVTRAFVRALEDVLAS